MCYVDVWLVGCVYACVRACVCPLPWKPAPSRLLQQRRVVRGVLCRCMGGQPAECMLVRVAVCLLVCVHVCPFSFKARSHLAAAAAKWGACCVCVRVSMCV